MCMLKESHTRQEPAIFLHVLLTMMYRSLNEEPYKYQQSNQYHQSRTVYLKGSWVPVTERATAAALRAGTPICMPQMQPIWLQINILIP